MKSILIILPYFGPFPNMFPFWLESCKLNKTVDFLIATDQDIHVTAKNIKFFHTSLKEIKSRIEKLVGFEVWLEKPYKLCDFKPLYYDIFIDFTKGYDFWGYCDCDLIFGDIRSVITDELLSSKDYILGMGHFHLQRVDDEKYEQVWKSARGLWRDIQWKDVFVSPNNEWFDELPYGVSGRYYELFPDLFWSGFGAKGRCYESPTPKFYKFFDGYNCYRLYKNDQGYLKHIERLPFFRREETGDINNIVYVKDGINLYMIGTNKSGQLIKLPILYVHFYKRKFDIKTDCLDNYMICPNVFCNVKSLNNFNVRWYATNPLFYIKLKLKRLFMKLKRAA